MIKMKKLYKSSLLLLIAAAFLFSCKKDISQIGVNVVGDNPLEVIYVDTFSIRAYSELIDSMRTDELSSHLLGAYKDPVFGTVNASIYSQFRLEAGNEDYQFQEGAVFDSIRLYLSYANDDVYGGDPNFPSEIHLSIYEVGDQIYRDSAYYQFQNLRTKDELLADFTFVPSFNDSVYVNVEVDENGDTTSSDRILAPISIPLSDELGQRLMMYDSTVFEDNETFLNEFAGLYITTLDQHLPSSDGSMINVNFLSDYTKVTLYYHYIAQNDEGNDITYREEFDLVCNSNTARFGNYNHYDYFDASPEFKSQVLDLDTSNLENYGREQVYLQGLSGVRTVLKFPYIHKMDDYYNYAVNEVKLFLWDVNDASSNLGAISSLSLSQIVQLTDSTTAIYAIPDASGGSTYFNGNYNGIDGSYFFRITQYMQDLIQGFTVDNQLRIEIVGGAVHANRSIIGGWNPTIDEEKKMKLQVIYTKIDSDQ